MIYICRTDKPKKKKKAYDWVCDNTFRALPAFETAKVGKQFSEGKKCAVVNTRKPKF
jgi:hypothetical protein